MAGVVPMILDAYIPTGMQVAAGKLRAIAIASRQRSPLLPDVPTVGEQGRPELVGSGFYGILAPAGTPPEIVARLNVAAVAALGAADVHERLLGQGYEVHASTPQGYADFIRHEIERWTPVAKAAGIKLE
jgi:tripartite-type tricarboxylate transporter receptor subunit TctC